MGRYPDSPGSVADSATSVAAAEAAEAFAPSQADRCERWFKAWTERGQLMSCEQCELAAKAAGQLGKHQSISARIRTDLFVKRQCLYKVGIDRMSGQPVCVWYTSDTSNLIVDKKGRIIFRTRRNTTDRQAVVYGWGYEP